MHMFDYCDSLQKLEPSCHALFGSMVGAINHNMKQAVVCLFSATALGAYVLRQRRLACIAGGVAMPGSSKLEQTLHESFWQATLTPCQVGDQRPICSVGGVLLYLGGRRHVQITTPQTTFRSSLSLDELKAELKGLR